MKRRALWIGGGGAAAGIAVAVVFAAARAGWVPDAWLSVAGLSTSGSVEDAGLFCKEHGVPEKFCTLCHEELKTRLPMCAEHGLPEAICTLCHPEVAKKFGLAPICTAHGLPEHFCAQCSAPAGGSEGDASWCSKHLVPQPLCTLCDPALEGKLPRCAEHGLPEALCTRCRPELGESLRLCKSHRLPLAYCTDPACKAELASALAAGGAARLPRVRLASPDIAGKAGLETANAESKEVTPSLKANGEVAFDETRLAKMRSRVPGFLVEVAVKEGDSVSAGQVVAIVDSAEVGEAKADYLAALPLVELWKKSLERSAALGDKGLATAKELLGAETELRRAQAQELKARQKLRNFGLEEAQIARLADESESDRNRFRLTSPLGGTVIRRRAVVGEAVDPADELFTVADLRRVWAHLDVFERDLARLEIGQAVIFRVRDLGPGEFPGKVGWIGAELNDQARTVRLRVELENSRGLLRAGMFGVGEVQLGKPRTSLFVPKDALQWEGSSFVVFVAGQPGQFEPRRVLAGTESGALFELPWADLIAGDAVVTVGSFLLLTEIQKGSIGAGCCGD